MPKIQASIATVLYRLNIDDLAVLFGKKRRNFVSFTIKERQSLPVVNHYLIVFNRYAVFLDWKNRLR